MSYKLCIFIIAMCFFVSGFVIGWKLGKAFGKRKETEDERVY